jgi:hypothetical protein
VSEHLREGMTDDALLTKSLDQRGNVRMRQAQLETVAGERVGAQLPRRSLLAEFPLRRQRGKQPSGT